ncbi:hypothetical protein C0Q92_20080 [Streptomyces albidoflavus]|uniref:Uncharacterized protein n=1 Tax=Streptomyces albidoflavus TaxID=1886 RepID=A0A8G1ZQU8_9ACTN|nr:hypothetical protein C0Q92_20080 [Streptomyces albidoflavus]
MARPFFWSGNQLRLIPEIRFVRASSSSAAACRRDDIEGVEPASREGRQRGVIIALLALS